MCHEKSAPLREVLLDIGNGIRSNDCHSDKLVTITKGDSCQAVDGNDADKLNLGKNGIPGG